MVTREAPAIGIRVISVSELSYVPDFLRAANDFQRLVSEIDVTVSGQFARTVDWAIRELSYASPAVLVAEPIVREGQEDNRQAIIDGALRGLVALKSSDDRPPYFTDQALVSAQRIVGTLSDTVDRVEIFSDGNIVDCTEIISTHVRAILRPHREMLGSVEGRLEQMSSHTGFQFSIYEPVLGSRITCELARDASADLRTKVVSMYELRVRVSGTIGSNVKGEVRSAKVSTIEALRGEQRYHKASEIAGLYDITDGMDAAEYIRSMRDA